MKRFIKDWILIFSILAGIISYFVYASIPWLDSTHAVVLNVVETVQPLLIFAMLFLTFCHINLHEIRPVRWHAWLLLVQGGVFTGIGLLLMAMPHSGLRVVLEGLMICMICPTATASGVITYKLGGSVAHITTYIILINILCTVLIPTIVPFVHPNPDLHVSDGIVLIMGKVFPLLLLPLVLAIVVRHLLPSLHEKILSVPDLSFYLWVVALSLAIAVTVRSIVHSTVPLSAQLGLVAVSLACCLLQFRLGRKIGHRYDDTVTAGQALGQKNTVFAIWLGYTFFSPVTSIAGGFYSIWHNVINSLQLYRHQHQDGVKNIDDRK